MPFGRCNARERLQRMMNEIFADELNSFVLVYLNDIFMYSLSVEEVWGHLLHALEHLRAAKLCGRIHKCELQKQGVDYLRCDISVDGIHASPEKVKSVME